MTVLLALGVIAALIVFAIVIGKWIKYNNGDE